MRQGQDHDDEEASGADSLADYIPGTPQTRIHWKRLLPQAVSWSRRVTRLVVID